MQPISRNTILNKSRNFFNIYTINDDDFLCNYNTTIEELEKEFDLDNGAIIKLSDKTYKKLQDNWFVENSEIN